MALSPILSSSSSGHIIPTYVVDSFTDKAFKGNPAGVCILQNRKLSPEDMLLIAQELGYSETAFVSILPEGEYASNSYGIRYFSPKMEIPLCGHATLAAAKVIFNFYNDSNTNEVHFYNIQNLDLIVTKEDDLISMIFPSYPTVEASVPDSTLEALGIDKVIDTRYNKETNILLLVIEDTKSLSKLTPDFPNLIKSIDTVNGILITAPSQDQEYDFHSRYFWPWSGTHEDPVTGGTHTFLTPYWAKKLGKTKLKSFQSSNRSGWMDVELVDNQLIKISSKARVILKGELYLDT